MPYPQRSFIFFRNYYRKLTTLAFIQCILVAVLLALTLFQLLHLPAPYYFATTTDGRVIPIPSPPTSAD